MGNLDEANREHETEGTVALQEFLAHIPLAAAQTDEKGRVLFANGALVALLRYTTPEALHGALLESFAVTPDVVREVLNRLSAAGVVKGLEVALRTRQGEPVDVQVVAVLHPKGWVDWLFLPPQDESRIRRNVVRSIVHQLTQPLTIVLGYSNLLVQQLPSDAPHRALAVKIEENARKMTDFVQALRQSVADQEHKG